MQPSGHRCQVRNTDKKIDKGDVSVKLRYTRVQKALEILALLVVAGTIIYLVLAWRYIPDKVPGHYGAGGVPDRWDSKGSVLILPVTGLLLYLMITGLQRVPGIWNTGVKVTEENSAFIYSNLMSMIIMIKLSLLIIFLYITVQSVRCEPLGSWFLPVSFLACMGPAIYYPVKNAMASRRLKK